MVEVMLVFVRISSPGHVKLDSTVLLLVPHECFDQEIAMSCDVLFVSSEIYR